MTQDPAFAALLEQIRSCRICATLPLGPKPVLQASAQARVLIAGQAPGRRAHDSGIPFDDASGDRLRDWLGLDRATFYDNPALSLVPMGFCYPGTGTSGDLPPRPECARAWRQTLLDRMPHLELVLVLGRYAIDWHFPEARRKTVTSLSRNWQHRWPDALILPHPSPRNNRWLKQNPWFEAQIVPMLRARLSGLCRPSGEDVS